MFATKYFNFTLSRLNLLRDIHEEQTPCSKIIAKYHAAKTTASVSGCMYTSDSGGGI